MLISIQGLGTIDIMSESETSRTQLNQFRGLRVFKKVITKNRLGAIGFIITVAALLAALFAPEIAPYQPNAQNVAAAQLQPPSVDHLMGTDQYGRDIFSRILYGARISLGVSLVSISISVIFGVSLGLLAGYYEGIVDEIIMRIMDMVFSFPAIVLAITIIAVLSQSLFNLMIAIGAVYTPVFARVTRSGVLSVREETYIRAAKALGDSDLNIITRDILPNIVAPIIVQASISLAFAILVESSLSFLGLGTPPPTASWGRMLSSGQNFMQTAWWTITFPGLAIMITILGFNFLGDAIRDVLDPKHDAESGGRV